MGKYLILKSGSGGVDTDDVSATAADVIKGKTAGVFGHDEPVTGTLELSGNAGAGEVLTGKTFYTTNPKSKQTGTMPNRGAVSQALNAGGSYTIPAGYHNGSGKVTANSLVGQTSANATAAYISSGKTAWVNGSKITGTLATQGGSTTTPGTANKTIVTASKHVTGNIVVAGNSNLAASNIKKGVNIFGVTGTFQGYVDSPLYLYNSGTFSNLCPNKMTSVQGDIAIKYESDRFTGYFQGNGIRTSDLIDLSNHKIVSIQFSVGGSSGYSVTEVLSVGKNSTVIPTSDSIKTTLTISATSKDVVMTVNVENLTGMFYIKYLAGNYLRTVRKIWLT